MDDKREGAKENVNFSVPGHVEGVDGTVFGSDVSASRTRVVETNFSNSRIRNLVAEGGLGSRSGSQIEENRVEEEKHSNEEGYNGNAEGGMVIPKKRRKKVSSSRTHGMKTYNAKRSQIADKNITLNQEVVHISKSAG
ncbi:hypothetical protein LWI29_005493 [Acer saccharum]|uniref:Uncharacterized protein n=1 Tax=Acer saccharum TaxID=4024 RepID=A0AA39SXF2_ACESA|nr:hypothetical protein LWI29_005493 [Acer saccharum]